jgi:hypothetical protein
VPGDERSSELIGDVVLKPAAVSQWIFALLGAAPGTRWMTCSRFGCGGPGVSLAGGRTCGCWAGKLARS